MRIDLNSNLLPPESSANVSTAKRSDGVPPVSGSDRELAQLQSACFSATELTTAAIQLPEVRQEKVAALAAQVRAGSYRVSAEQTARAIVSQMQAA